MTRWWPFIPYSIIGAVHLGAIFLGAADVSTWTKFALMPALLFALLLSLPARRSEVALWAGLAVVLSWAGDVLLEVPGDAAFLLGLGSFLLAHVCYLVLFIRPLRRRRWSWWSLIYGAWLFALLTPLLLFAGSFAVPITVYGIVLCVAAAAATGTSSTIAVGALLFLASDSVLAMRLFLPGFVVPNSGVIIMVLYILGQGLIIAGTVAAARASRTRVASDHSVA